MQFGEIDIFTLLRCADNKTILGDRIYYLFPLKYRAYNGAKN
jgi:hypothetical protein